MAGILYIDGIDSANYGIKVLEYKNLIPFAKLKTPPFTDWGDKDGIDVDLSEPAFDKKEVAIKFYAASYAGYLAFIQLFDSNGYHIFNFNELGCTRKLRFISEDKGELHSFKTFTIKFSDDFPFYDFVTPTDNSVMTPLLPTTQDRIRIDGVSLSRYGIRILEGTDGNLLTQAEIKENRVISLYNKNGVIYDDSMVKFKSKKSSLNLFMHMNVTDFWNNYNRFFYNLTRKDEREFYFDRFSKTFNCYYEDCSAEEFALIGTDIWYKFKLDLVFTNFRL